MISAAHLQHVPRADRSVRKLQPLYRGVKDNLEVHKDFPVAVEHQLRVEAFAHAVILAKEVA